MKTVAVTFTVLLLVKTYLAIGALDVTNQSVDQVIGSIVNFLLYSSPIEKIVQVLYTRSVKCIRIGMCVASAVGNSLWTVATLVSNCLIAIY